MPAHNDKLQAFLGSHADIEVFEVMLPGIAGGLKLPISALVCFERSEFIGAYLGSEFQRVYTLLKQQEMDEFDRQVTPLEYDACL